MIKTLHIHGWNVFLWWLINMRVVGLGLSLQRNVSRRSNVMKWICELEMCVMCNCVQCDVCQWSLCGVGCRKGGSGFIMGPSLWALARCQQPQMPLTGCWFSRWSLEVAAEHRGLIGAHINHRIWLVLLWLIFTRLQWARALSNKAEILPPRAQNSLASSDRPESQRTTTQIDIFNVSFASLMFGTVPPQKTKSWSFPLMRFPPTQSHSQTDRRAQTQTSWDYSCRGSRSLIRSRSEDVSRSQGRLMWHWLVHRTWQMFCVQRFWLRRIWAVHVFYCRPSPTWAYRDSSDLHIGRTK